MASLEASIFIRRPREDVFAYMNDVAREPEWQPAIREAVQEPPGRPGVGTVRRYASEFLGKRFTNEYVNTGFEPGRRVAYESTPRSDLTASGEITWEDAEGGTRVVMQIETRPPRLLRLLPRGLVEGASRKELETCLRRVKEILERRS